MTISEFGRRINTHRRNVYDIFNRESVDTALLMKISQILEHNFFETIIEESKTEGKTFAEATYNYPEKIKGEDKISQIEDENRQYQLEIEYLKQLIKEKDKIIFLLEKKD